jgi:predicted aspartyl protease
MIPVSFMNGGECVDTTALLDSGADFVAMTKDMANALGLDLSGPREPCMTPIGSGETVEVRITIKISQGHESHTLVVPAKVLLIEQNGTPPLLGRMGFFDMFEITFNQSKDKIRMKRMA